MYDSKELDTNLELLKAKKQSMKLVIDNQQLIKENQALQARVAELEAGFKQTDASLISMGSKGTLMPTINYQEMLRIVGKSPKQSLAEIQAQAVEGAVYENRICLGVEEVCYPESLIHYAQQLRKESE